MKQLWITSVLVLFSLTAWPQCETLTLSVSEQEICAPGIIQYRVNNAPSGSSFVWNAGKGPVSGTDTFYGFYDQAITFNPVVNVTLPDGSKCAVTSNSAVVIRSAPEPVISVSRVKLCDGPDTVTLSTDVAGLKMISWVVDGINYFNKGGSVVHNFQSLGQKDVFLVVEDSFGCRASISKKGLIEVLPIVSVNFNADVREGCVPQKVNYTPEISLNGESVQTMKWSFEGANLTNYTGQTPPELVYIGDGNYDVTLELTTSKGCVFKESKLDYVGFGRYFNPQIEVSKMNLCANEQIDIAAKPKMPGRYQFDLNGAEITGKPANNVIRAKYTDSGVYTIHLKYDYNGCEAEATLTNAVVVDFTKASFDLIDNFHCKAPHTIHLSQNSYTSNPALTFSWNIFNAGSGQKVFTSSQPVDSLTTNWGVFDVQLIATSANGCSDTLTKENNIRVKPIQPDFIAEPTVACIGQDIQFRSTTPQSTWLEDDQFLWKWYDLDDKTLLGQANGGQATFSYNALGKYDVKLIAWNSIGCKDSFHLEDYIEIVSPNYNFHLTDSVFCEGDNFTLVSDAKPEHADFRHEWIITPVYGTGQTITKNGKNAEVKMKYPGIYDVQYNASIAGGCRDTVIHYEALKVNGVKAEISIDSVNGCDAFVTTARADLIYDYHATFPSKGVTYRWFSDHGQKVQFGNPSATATSVSFSSPGVYRVKLEVVNGAGCSYVATSEEITVGVRSKFKFDQAILCANDVTELKQKSSRKPSGLTWKTVPADFNVQITTDENNNALVKPLEAGEFTIRLIADKYGVCQDTFEQKFISLEVRSSFITLDSQLYCAPAYAQFEATSAGADSFFWNFGDGTSVQTTSRNVANVYTRNSGWLKGYDVTLISKSTYGCSDTITVKDKVKVVGPVPSFEIINKEGCSPLEVQFVNNSTNIQYYYLNYGDGSSLDSMNFGPHTYHSFSSAEYDEFTPSLYAVDSMGCVEILEADEQVVVHRSPLIQVALNDTAGCAPFHFTFSDKGQDADSFKWYVDNKVVSTYSKGEEFLLKPSTSQLRLEAKNLAGCTSTFTQNITAWQVPNVGIDFQDVVCLNEPIQFAVTDQSSPELVVFDWIFGDETTMWDTSSAERPAWTYTTAGVKMVNVNVENVHGCRASAVRNFTLYDRNAIPKGRIDFVTFTEDGDIDIQWQPVVSERIVSSNLYRTDLSTPVRTSYSFGTETYRDNLVTPSLYCYQVSYSDVCGLEGDPESVHCPVWLTVDNSEPFILTLNWTSYQGWDRVDVYEIYRVDASGAKRIAVVQQDVNTYRDEKRCRGEYTYFIVALRDDLRSRSNTVTEEAMYIKNRTPNDIRLATVNNEEGTVEVHWNSSVNVAFEKFILRKSVPSRPTDVIREYELSGASYTDFNVDIQDQAYRYEVVEVDFCGVETPVGRPGTSILLKAEYSGNASRLNWTPYEAFEGGVNKYIIQFKDDQGYTYLSEVNGANTQFVDDDEHEGMQGAFCYRILAVSADGKDTSVSNTACTTGESVVYMPNAFTPNNDGINETFKPVARFVKDWDDNTFRDYTFAVYNRWGQMVFETSSLEDGWDGTYMGEIAPEGTYIYTLTLTGMDGVLHRENGSVTLLR